MDEEERVEQNVDPPEVPSAPVVEEYEEVELQGLKGLRYNSPWVWRLLLAAFIGFGVYIVAFGMTYSTCGNSDAQMTGMFSCTDIVVVAVCESMDGGYFLMPEETDEPLIEFFENG